MSYYYRVIDASEESQYERKLADPALTLFSKRQKISEPGLGFIVEDVFGDRAFDTQIYGFCARGGNEIFIRRGLSERDLILTVAHECCHAHQAKTGKHSLNSESKERDARIAEYEVGLLPSDPRELRLWLFRELEFEREPGLRELYARVDTFKAPASSITVREVASAAQRPQETTARNRERIEYIQRLLSRLPNEPKFQGQRVNLAAELAELTRGIGIAA